MYLTLRGRKSLEFQCELVESSPLCCGFVWATLPLFGSGKKNVVKYGELGSGVGSRLVTEERDAEVWVMW